MRRTTVAAALLPCALALTLSACGSSAKSTGAADVTTQPSPTGSPNTHLTSAQVIAGADAAVKTATALHLSGTFQDSGSIAIDVQVNADSGGGTIGKDGVSIPIRLVGGVSYLEMTPAVIKGLVDTQVPSGEQQMVNQLLTNKWVDSNSASGKGMTQSFDEFLTLKPLVDKLVSGPDNTFTYLGTATVDGQQVAQYRDASAAQGTDGTMSIPLYGPILPVKLDEGAKGVLTLVWNKPVPVTAPPAADIVTMPSSS